MICLAISSNALIRPRPRPSVFFAAHDALLSLTTNTSPATCSTTTNDEHSSTSHNSPATFNTPLIKSTNTSPSATTNGEHSSTCTSHNSPATFNIPLIKSIKPFPQWLEGEMRSNHAGETGAVNIYQGAIKALDIRRSLGLSYGDARKGRLSYEDRLRAFALEHRDSEQGHVDLLNAILDGEGVSILLPAWSAAGFTLGFASTIFCPRGMYLTTEAVETFVEEHYMAQIRRLRYEAAEAVLSDDSKDVGPNATRTLLKSHAELIAMLEHCCEDEVHHKEEARERAAEGPFPWFSWVDTSWQWFVQTGSAVAANCAKRI